MNQDKDLQTPSFVNEGRTEEIAEDIMHRRKVLWISPEELLALVAHNTTFITLPIIPEAEGAEYHHAFYDYTRDEFGVVVCRKDWPVIPGGNVPPTLERELHTIRLTEMQTYETVGVSR